MLLTPKDQAILFRVLILNYILLVIELICVGLYMTIFESQYLLIPALVCLMITIICWFLYLQRRWMNKKQSVHPKLKQLHLRFNRSPHSDLHFGLIMLLETALVVWLLNLMFEFLDARWLNFITFAVVTIVMSVMMTWQHLIANKQFLKNELY